MNILHLCSAKFYLTEISDPSYIQHSYKQQLHLEPSEMMSDVQPSTSDLQLSVETSSQPGKPMTVNWLYTLPQLKTDLFVDLLWTGSSWYANWQLGHL